MRDGALVVYANLARGMADDKGNARYVVIGRRALGKQAVALQQIAVIGGVHDHRVAGRGVNHLADQFIHIRIAAEEVRLLDFEVFAVGLQTLSRPDLLIGRLALQRVIYRRILGKLKILVHVVVRRRTQEGKMRLVKGDDQEIILILVSFHKVLGAL